MSAGAFIRNPDRRVKLIVFIQAFWVATLVVLILWWGTLIRQQSDEIASLQTQLGVAEPTVQERLDRTQRMVAGESGTFLILIFVTNSILVYLFYRDSRRSRSIQAFFASITHELRTPLTSIKLQAEALQSLVKDPQHESFIKRLLEDVERLEGQVQRSLELARIEGGGTLNVQPVQIRNFFQSKILPSYESAENRIEFDLSIADSFVLADQAALVIIFRNIIDNAIKYSTSLPAVLQIQGILPSPQSETYQLVIVHENSQFEGDASALGKLFERGRNSQGAGVGLYLVETLMRKMKGNVTFSAENEHFTHAFTFGVDHGR